MRIAQIAPLFESVPPRLYGGTERIASWLCEELVDMGHDVTLFASADSITTADLVPCVTEALRLNPTVKDWVPYYMVMLDRVRQMAHRFDILHFHIDAVHFPLFNDMAGRTVTTLHGRQDLPDLKPLYLGFPDMPLVSISDSQRKPVPDANFVATVLHGMPSTVHRPNFAPKGDYLAFLGRISPEKAPDRAIELARAAGLPLKIAAKIDKADADYWRDVIEPMVRQGGGVEFIGEVDERQKTAFLGNAAGVLFPIRWPEPFGIVMIEAMACGTPVLAFDQGSVREVLRDGRSGRIVCTMDEALRAVHDLPRMDRRVVRAEFEERFTARRMAVDYLRVYQQLLAKESASETIPAEETASPLPLFSRRGHFAN